MKISLELTCSSVPTMLPIIILRKEGLSLEYKGPLTQNTRQLFAFASLEGDPKLHDDINDIKDWVSSSLPDVDLTKPFNVNGVHSSCWMGGKEEKGEYGEFQESPRLMNYLFKPRGVAVRVSFYDLIINLVRSQHFLLQFGMIESFISYL